MGGRRCRHNFEFDGDLVLHADGAPGDFDGRDAIVGLLQGQRSVPVVERYGCCNLTGNAVDLERAGDFVEIGSQVFHRI